LRFGGSGVTDDKAFQDWLDHVMQYPLPRNKIARVHILAKELAAGAIETLWDFERISLYRDRVESEDAALYVTPELLARLKAEDRGTVLVPVDDRLRRYFRERWGCPDFDNFPEFTVMLMRGYASLNQVSGAEGWLSILEPALDLLDKTDPSTVFISYKRSESSALALLVLARLKEAGLNPFVDMAIEPGANWKDFLKDKIESSDYVVLLLGKETLHSPMTLNEIMWARAAKKVIIPIWHNDFQYRSSDWQLLPDLDDVLTNTHTIIVQNESAGGYNAALTELLNRFGFTP